MCCDYIVEKVSSMLLSSNILPVRAKMEVVRQATQFRKAMYCNAYKYILKVAKSDSTFFSVSVNY